MNAIVLKIVRLKTILLVAFSLLFSTLLVVPPTFAQVAPDDGNNRAPANGGDVFGIGQFQEETNLGKRDLNATINGLINVLLGFLAVIAVVIMLWGGFRWMTAAGNTEKVDEAKKIIGAGIIGLVIILASWSIAKFALVQIGNATGTNNVGEF